MSKKTVMNFFQVLSRAFLTPLALIAAASLLMGIASFFTSGDVIGGLPFLGAAPIQYFFRILMKMGTIISSNYSVIYAITLAYALSSEDKEVAAFSGFVGYISFLAGMGMLIENSPGFAEQFPKNGITSVLGINTVNTGLLGGIIVGILTAAFHRHLKRTKFPMAFSFFQGNRFVPIACVLIFVIFGHAFPFVWIYISRGIDALAGALGNMGIFGPFLYGFVERLLIPTGLHQIWISVVRDTAVSGVYEFASGVVIEGQRPAFMQFLAEGLPLNASLRELVKFSYGPQIPIMLGGLPAAGLAMYHCADKDKRKAVKPLLFTGILTAMVAGISEPLEFTFLFAAPLLYVCYAVLYGMSWVLMYVLGNQIGFGSGLIEFTVFGLMRSDSNWWVCLIVAACEFIVIYFLFRWWISRFDVKTPGRGGDYDETLSLFDTAETGQGQGDLPVADVTDPKAMKARIIIKALGGRENIEDVDACMSRLRITLGDSSRIDEEVLRKTGCSGIIKPDPKNVQIVYGTTVGIIKEAVIKQLKK
ncbi:PTS system maltose-and glucose-specific EIICB component [Clostridium sp. C105KSO15]|nr:PTS system maltose-and glucose-specific EIICB component [Clostridium sp. C105KSO15]